MPEPASLRHGAVVVLAYSLLVLGFFSPALVEGRLLAYGDGLVYSLPYFFAHPGLWSTELFAGFPAFADPLGMGSYPLSWVFRALGAWNAFILSAYVLAASFMYGYVYSLTRSVVGAAVAGTAYALSGFLVMRLGHVYVIHAAAWIPLLLWSLDRLSRRRDRRWILPGSLAVAMIFAAGHPQFSLYGVSLGLAYAATMVWTARAGRSWYAAASGATFVLGLGLIAFQLVPTSELAPLSRRGRLTFDLFVMYSLTPIETLQLLFPHLFGGSTRGPYGTPFFGQWGLVETSGFVGLLPLAAAFVAVGHVRSRVTWFWAAVAIAGVLLALGPATPLARLLFDVPVYGLFRAPARHLLESTVAVAVLAGLGVAGLERAGSGARRLAAAASAGLLGVVGAALLLIGLLRGEIGRLAVLHGIAPPPLFRAEILVPIGVAVASAAALGVYGTNPRDRRRAMILLAVLVVDLGSFGWFLDWRYESASRDVLRVPAALEPLREEARASGRRIATFEGAFAATAAAPSNLNLLWGIPSATGYTPLELQRSFETLRWYDRRALRPESSVLDVLSVRYLLTTRRRGWGFEWGPPLGAVLGNGLSWSLPGPVAATRVGLVGALVGAESLPDGAVVAQLTVVPAEGGPLVVPVRAGEDLSEGRYEGRDGEVRHRRATVFRSDPVRGRDGRWSSAHVYLTNVSLGGRRWVRALELEPRGGRAGVYVESVSLADDETGRSFPIVPDLDDRARWRLRVETEDMRAYENLRALPRAWLVWRTKRLRPQSILASLHASKLPNGLPFDPSVTALVEAPVPLQPGEPDPDAAVRVLSIEGTRLVLETESASNAFLVLSDVQYPGWSASVDGEPARIVPTDHLLRGVSVPAGRHRVEFVYRSAALATGAGISAAAAFVLSLVCFPVTLLSPRRRAKGGMSRRGRREHGGPSERRPDP